jgi:hypothetical protein
MQPTVIDEFKGGDIASPPLTPGRPVGCAGPQLAADVRFVPASRPVDGGLLHRRSTALVARLGSLEWEVLRRFDGTALAIVADRLERECGVRLSPDDLAAFTQRAQAIGLLEHYTPPPLRRKRWSGLTMTMAIWNPERVFEWCAPRISRLCHAAIVCGLAVIAIASATVPHGMAGGASMPVGMRAVLFLLVLNIVSVAHECAHGIVLHRCGGSVREMGIRFVLGWPCWYCDITESYLLPRVRDRVAVILAGPIVQAVLCGAIMLAVRGRGSYAAAVQSDVALIGLLTALNFFPLVRSDGYYLLTELIAMPNLRADAWRWLVSFDARRCMRAELRQSQRLAIAVYALASAAFCAFVLVRAGILVERVATGEASLSIRTFLVTLSALVMMAAVLRRKGITS